MKSSPPSPISHTRIILLLIVCTVFISIGQLLLKSGAANTDSMMAVLTNIPLIAGLASYVVSAVLLLIALKYGELSLIYPFIALSFIWVNLISLWVFHEHITFINWVGIVAIVIGVSLIGVAGQRHRRTVQS